MPRYDYLRRLAADWRAQHDPGRLALLAEFDGDRLHVAELRAAPAKMRIDGFEELAITIGFHVVTMLPPKFREMRSIIADVGLHALARRFQRAADHSDKAVMADLSALARAWRGAAGEFRIPAPSGGEWIGAATSVRGQPVLCVRTFV